MTAGGEERSIDIDTEAERIRDFVRRGNYHAAYNIALSALNACRRANDRSGVEFFIDVIREVVDALAEEYGDGVED